MASIEEFTLANRVKTLRISGAWSAEAGAAIMHKTFDALEFGGQDFLPLAPHAEQIKWLWGLGDGSSVGLEALQYLERVDAHGDAREPAFDWRQLPRLRSFSSTAAHFIKPETLNHPALELLDLNGLKAKNIGFLSAAAKLMALRLVQVPIQTLAGLEATPALKELRLLHCSSLKDIAGLSHVTDLEILELAKTPKIADISAIYALHNLRLLYVDGRKARQPDHCWLLQMPKLECAGLYIETESIDWDIFARLPRLYDLAFYSNHDFVAESDEAIIAKLSAHGKTVRSLRRFPKDRFPAFMIEFVPPADIAKPMPQHAYTINMISQVWPGRA